MRFFLALLLSWLPGMSQAEWQDLAAIRATAQEFAQRQTAAFPGQAEIQVGKVDSRLRLTRCVTLEAFLPPGAKLWGNATLGVRCLQPEAWSIYLPVTVKVMGEVIVAARPLVPGQVLKAADLRLQSADLTQLPPGALTRIELALDKIMTTGLSSGNPLQAGMLRASYAVRQGQTVRLRYTGGSFKVSAEGKALANAAAGEMVQVRVLSGKVVGGIAQSGGLVEVR